MGFLELPEKEQDDFDFEDDDIYPGEEVVIDALRTRSRGIRPEIIMGIVAALAAVLCMGMAALGGWALVLAALAVLWRYHAVSRKQFGGITGDLAGWFLQTCECVMALAVWLGDTVWFS